MGEIFWAFLRLGLMSFGGPVAHIGYFRAEFVARRGWLDEAEFAQALALAQFLPGPASSQMGFAIGWRRGGPLGALAAFAGFTAPSAGLMAAAGLWAAQAAPAGAVAGALAGLKLVALAVVAQALVGMARSLCPDARRRGAAVLVAGALVLWPFAGAQIGAIALGAGMGALWLRPGAEAAGGALSLRGARWVAGGLLLLALGLALIPFARPYLGAGALVFGGGHVVLPLLREALGGAIAEGVFLSGYGLAQAMPGPLFTFASYLGAVQGGLWGAAIATLAIFVPGFALYALVAPLWARIGARAGARGAVAGANAAVVGVLGAAFFGQILPEAFLSPGHGALAAALTALAFATRLPPLALVVMGAGGGAAFL